MHQNKYFGTDGVRGEANIGLTVEIAYRIGRYLGYHYKGETILIGRDTRKSGVMFEAALVSGITESGGNADLLGVCATPCVAYLTRTGKYQTGIMISASHNPYYDNGIKLFNDSGEKVSPELEAKIEAFIEGEFELETSRRAEIGTVKNIPEDIRKYVDYLKSKVPLDLKGYKVALDLANGSATAAAATLFQELGAEIVVMADKPDGLNINVACGSTHPETMCALTVKENCHIGFAFDGDADRVMGSDETGQLIDGDKTIYLCGKYMDKQNTLYKHTVVTTVMANIGLYKALDQLNISTEKTQVGDKYVYECMKQEGYNLGGEQSGHIIFSDYATTGDGLLTALKIMEVVVNSKENVSELVEGISIYPQLLVNLEVKDKQVVLNDKEICDKVATVEKELGDSGQILVRPSGTEPLIRVMVEAESDELCHKYVYQVIDLIKEKGL